MPNFVPTACPDALRWTATGLNHDAHHISTHRNLSLFIAIAVSVDSSFDKSSGALGREFESLRAHHPPKYSSVSQPCETGSH